MAYIIDQKAKCTIAIRVGSPMIKTTPNTSDSNFSERVIHVLQAGVFSPIRCFCSPLIVAHLVGHPRPQVPSKVLT